MKGHPDKKSNRGRNWDEIGTFLGNIPILEQDGKIWAESSREGSGSTFYVEMPAI